MKCSSWVHCGLRVTSISLAVVASAGLSGLTTASEPMAVYVGTYAEETKEGIHVFHLDLTDGHLKKVGAVSGIKNPSFQALHPNGRYLYSVSEANDSAGRPGGAVAAFAVDGTTGQLTLLNSETTMGSGPCHLMVDHAGKNVCAANYSGGSVAVLPLLPDGRVKTPCTFLQHQGSSVHPRQKGPHAHSVLFDRADRYALAADLGLDQVLIYQYVPRDGTLTPNPQMPALHTPPGSGPRHLAFHPQGRFLYVINELSSTILACSYDEQRGELKSIQEISALPADFRGENTTAEIAVSPDGRFLYGSNRGHHSIAVFSIDEQAGTLTTVAHHATRGEQPRNFAIDPQGAYLLAANQSTDNLVIFRIDAKTGQLNPTAQQVSIPQPVCVTFLPLRPSR